MKPKGPVQCFTQTVDILQPQSRTGMFIIFHQMLAKRQTHRTVFCPLNLSPWRAEQGFLIERSRQQTPTGTLSGLRNQEKLLFPSANNLIRASLSFCEHPGDFICKAITWYINIIFHSTEKSNQREAVIEVESFSNGKVKTYQLFLITVRALTL